MKLCILSLPQFFEQEALALSTLLQQGGFRLHLRKPGASPQELASLLEQIDPIYWSRIVLHDAFELVKDYPVGGLHLNQRNPQAPPSFRGSISCSCHNWDEVQANKSSCDYLFISPIFNSISKPNYARAFSQDELEEAQQKGWIDSQVIALGGITARRIPSLRALGFGGVAVLGAIWGDYMKCFSTSDLRHSLHSIITEIEAK